MVKFIKIFLRSSGNQILYPPAYKDPKFICAEYVDTNGNLYVLGAINDSDLPAELESHADVTVLSKDDAIAFSEQTQTRKETITNEARIRRIELKVNMGQELTADELAAIDINNPESGFGMSKILADRFAEL